MKPYEPTPRPQAAAVPPRVRMIINSTLSGMTGDFFTDLMRFRYSLMLIYRENDFGDDAHMKRSLKWKAGFVPTTDGSQS
jgi:hypothetical protein